MVENIRHDALLITVLWTEVAHHGMSLATSGLPICKDSAVISFEGCFNDRERSIRVDLLLGAEFIEDFIKPEGLVILATLPREQTNLLLVLFDGHRRRLFVSDLSGNEGPASDNNFDSLRSASN